MFWEGFEKQARMAGVKATNPLNHNGKMVGNRPSSMVSTVSAYKPAPLPTAAPHSASDISHASLPISDTIKPSAFKKKIRGVGETVI